MFLPGPFLRLSASTTVLCTLSTALQDETTLGSLHFWSWVVMTTSLFWSIAFNMEGKLWLHGLVIRLVSVLFYLILPAPLGVGKLQHAAQMCPTSCLYKVLLEHSHASSFLSMANFAVQWSSGCNRDRMSGKAYTFLTWPFAESLLVPALRDRQVMWWHLVSIIISLLMNRMGNQGKIIELNRISELRIHVFICWDQIIG